mgnify:CR=1 FL=1
MYNFTKARTIRNKGDIPETFHVNSRKQVCVTITMPNRDKNRSNVDCHKAQTWDLCCFHCTNDLPQYLKYAQASMFADGTVLSCTGKTAAEIESKLNSDLLQVNSLLKANRLSVNTKKTEFMLIASKRNPYQSPSYLRIHLDESHY